MLPSAIPDAAHTPIPILYHRKQQIKETFDDDVEKDINESVPIREPVVWCSHMVVVAKK